VILLSLLAGCLSFLLVLKLTNVVGVTGDAARTAMAATNAMRAPGLTDDEKEAQVRKAAVRLMGSFVTITLIGCAALAAPALIVWLGAAIGLYALEDAIEVALGWPFLIGATIVFLAIWGIQRQVAGRRSIPATAADENSPGVPYSRVDRALHRLAFATPQLQKNLAEVETQRFRDRINPEHAARPVFITSLPRAGTTVMLDILAGLPEFASATYRGMPFALTPLLWPSVTRGFQQSAEKAERAHGDGLEVGFDSPEAFEEMVWKAFWPDHYRKDRITPWRSDAANPEFEAFFRTYMTKIVASKGGAANRYISKNNANIARLGLLERLFPDARFVIPIRSPWAQSASLLRQHQRFDALHAHDDFALTYMEGLGHYEFGRALRPIAFGGRARDPEAAHTLEFWLDYWISAYQAVLETAGPQVILVDHDALCTWPERYLPVLGDALEISDAAGLLASAGRLRPQRDVPPPDVSQDLLGHAEALHAELVGLSIRPHDARQFA
jgi:Sulfotransferase family